MQRPIPLRRASRVVIGAGLFLVSAVAAPSMAGSVRAGPAAGTPAACDPPPDFCKELPINERYCCWFPWKPGCVIR